MSTGKDTMVQETLLMALFASDKSLKSAQTLCRKLEPNSSNVHLKGDMSQLKNDMTPIYYWLDDLQNLAGYENKDCMERLMDQTTLVSSSMRRLRKTATHSKQHLQSESSLYQEQKEAMIQVIQIITGVLNDLTELVSDWHKRAREQKSPEHCSLSLKDSDVAQFSSLSIQENSSKEKSMPKAPEDKEKSIPKASEEGVRGCSSEHSEFSTLPIHEKLVCITAASFAFQRCIHDVRSSRKQRKLSEYYHDSCSSYLNKDELAIIGELDGKKAEYIYNESQKRPYKHESFSTLVDHNRQATWRDRDVWFHLGKPFVGNDKVPDILPTEAEAIYDQLDTEILGDKARRKVLKERQRYEMMMEKATKLYRSDNEKKKKR